MDIMDLRKIKKCDLYSALDEIQTEFKKKFNNNILEQTNSNHYGSYNREFCLLYNYSNEELRKMSYVLQSDFHKLSCGYLESNIKEFPENYPEEIKYSLGAEVVAVYVSTERLNNLPFNDDLRLARFIIRNKSNIIKLING